MKKDDTKTHILDTAVDLFWRKSYNGVSMNELSAAAGVNKATIYQHFGSKESLTVTALKRAAKKTEAYVYESSFADNTSAEARITSIFAKVYTMHLEMQKHEGNCRGCPFVNMGVELATSSEPIRKAVDEAFTLFRGYYSQIADNCETGASLMTIMNGCLVASKIENRPEAILEGQKRALALIAS